MTDTPTLETEEIAPIKRKGVKRRAFLIGGAAIVGGGLFALKMADTSARKAAIDLTTQPGEGSFQAWVKIAADDSITIYSPHIDFGQGSQTGLAQMLADELDADWSHVGVTQAPPEGGFGNTTLGRFFVGEMSGMPGLIGAMPTSWISMIARNKPLQLTGGSSAIRATGQYGFRVIGAAARLALIEEAASRLHVPASELTTAASKVTHLKSGRSLRYGELAEAAAQRSLVAEPSLKDRKDYNFIGKSVHRFDIPSKVNGTARYAMDVYVQDMRVAAIMMAPVRDGKLISVDPAPALAVPGVEQVIKLDDAVVVVAKGYWQATKGIQALSPQFSDGGHAGVSSESIFAAQDKLNAEGKALSPPTDGTLITADYKVPFLHQAMMEPWAMVAHFKDGKLEAWGGVQDPLSTRMKLAKAAGIGFDDVTFHPLIMGGGFGRRFPDYSQIIPQIAQIAKQFPHPVKLIWSREQEVQQGAYRPQVAARLQATLGKNGKIASWASDYAQKTPAGPEGAVPYTIPDFDARHHDYISNQVDAFWRSVNASQFGFFNESFVDELAHAAGKDPYQFRRDHLSADSRHLKVLDEAAKQGGWGTPLPEGVGRGIALVQSFGSIVAHVIEASLKEDGTPKVLKVTAAVDCGTTVNPLNGTAQIEGGIVMGLSSAIGEAITLDKGAVVQSNFSDYPILKLADAPQINVHFIESGAPMGGLGEPGVPPVAPALAGALFALTGKRVRQLPFKDQAKA